MSGIPVHSVNRPSALYSVSPQPASDSYPYLHANLSVFENTQKSSPLFVKYADFKRTLTDILTLTYFNDIMCIVVLISTNKTMKGDF